MNGTIRCVVCRQEFVVRLHVELASWTDPGFVEIDDKADLSECCQHIQDGGEYEVVDYDTDDGYLDLE